MKAPILVGEQVIQNKRKTAFLLFIFITIIIILSIAIGFLIESLYMSIITGVIFSTLYVLISTFTFSTIMLKSMGAERVTGDNNYHLLNQVEGLAIAAGIPMPEVYVIPSRVPNAFATGLTPKKGVVGVTQGLLDMMDKQELEGVIAHEIAHIKNYDILVATVALALSQVLVYLSRVVSRLLMTSSGNQKRNSKSKDSGGVAIIFILATFFAVFGRLFSFLLRMAISRKREYMADATAISIAGYSEGLARALEKLRDGGSKSYSKKEIERLGGQEMLGFFIVNPVKSAFSTHPDINKRIEIIRRSY